MAQQVQRRQAQRSPGDFTGLQKQRQAKEQADVAREREAEISMENAADEEAMQHGVFDAQTGERINELSDEVHLVGDPDSDVEEIDPDTDPTRGLLRGRDPEAEPVLTGQEPPEYVEQLLAERAKKRTKPEGVHRAQSKMVKIRTNCDIPDMTYGMVNQEPNNFTFREGMTYSVPRELAEHLSERGLLLQWVG